MPPSAKTAKPPSPPPVPFPWATISFAVLLIALAIAAPSIGEESMAKLRLNYHELEPLTPLQLVTSVFISSGVGALIPTLLGLAIAGPLLEARLGYKRFQTAWLLLSLLSGGADLLLLLGSEDAEPGFGAARVLWGVAAAATWIDPLRPLRPLPSRWLGGHELVVPAWMMALGWIFFGLVLMTVDGGPAARAVLGVVPGILVGTLAVLLGWVPKDSRHVLALCLRRAPVEDPDAPPNPEKMSRADQAIRDEHLHSIDELARAGAAEAAFTAWQVNGGDRLAAPVELRERLLACLVKAGRWNDAKIILATFTDPSQRPAGVRLAEIQLLVRDKRPQKAYERLSELRAVPLSAPQKTLAQQLAGDVQRMQREGVLEIDD